MSNSRPLLTITHPKMISGVVAVRFALRPCVSRVSSPKYLGPVENPQSGDTWRMAEGEITRS